MMNTTDLREKLSKVIYRRLDIEHELSCADMHHLAQAISELERNDIFKAMTSLGSLGFGGKEQTK